jgi:hypothetical protein
MSAGYIDASFDLPKEKFSFWWRLCKIWGLSQIQAGDSLQIWVVLHMSCFFLILLLYTQVYIQINIDAGLRKEFSFLKEQIQVSKCNANVRFKRNWVEIFGKPTYYLTFMQPAKLITCPINHTRPVYPTANAHFTQSAYVSLIHSRPFTLRVQNIDPYFLLPKFWAGHSDLQESR